MFNVRPNNSTPGFRVGFDDDEVGFNVAEPYSFHEVAPSPSAKFDLAANPYWRVASDRLSGLGWGGTDLNFRPPPGVPGFRVKVPDDPPGFRVGLEEEVPGVNVSPDGSVRPTLPNAPSVPAFSYDPDGNAPQMTVPTATSLAGLPYNADSGLYPTPYRAYDPMAGGPPSYDPEQQLDRGRNHYPWVGGNPFGLVDPQGPYADPTALLGGGLPLPRPANSGPPAPTASEGVLHPNPLDSGGGFTLAGYGAGDPTNRADPTGIAPSPVQNTSGGGSGLIPSAQAQTPQPQPQKEQLQKDTSPGEVVVLPNGSTIPDPDSPSGELRAPVADLSAVAAAGRQSRETLRALRGGNPAVFFGSLIAILGMNVGQGGAFDYQRQGNRITGYTHLQQFKKVSNLNVGLFAQQAGLTLEEVLNIAGTFARHWSGNADPSKPYGLNDFQLEYITRGFRLGESGMYDPPHTP
jgi:RHS repeat-associated protein